MNIVFSVGRKDRNVLIGDVGPELKLKLPLEDTHRIGAEADDTLLDSLSSRHSCQCLSSSTRQHNDSRACSAVSKHFRQTTFLVSSNAGMRFQVHLGDVGIDIIITKVVFFH
eukprot:Lithocolla_globosa_v1_NODE_2341_length_2042_cov_3.188727.p3 type:complete len:112 gc:universal NODE_2341_length_2042_cov_3.188727:751-416(-)